MRVKTSGRIGDEVKLKTGEVARIERIEKLNGINHYVIYSKVPFIKWSYIHPNEVIDIFIK